MNEPRITCHRTSRYTLGVGEHRFNRECNVPGEFFEWEGPTWQPVAITNELLGLEDSLLKRLPWKLRETGRWDYFHNATWYARADGWRVLTWALWRSQSQLGFISDRVVFHIYKLAFRTGRFHPAPGEHFSWRHFWNGFRNPKAS